MEHEIVFVDPRGQRLAIRPGARGQDEIRGVVQVSVRRSLKEETTEIPKKGLEYTYLGYDYAEVSVEVRVWQEAEFAKLRRLIALFRPRGKEQKAPEVLQVIHPTLRRHDITHLYIFGFEEPPYDPIQGWQATLQLREWRPAYKKVKTDSVQIGYNADTGGADRDGTPTAQQRAQANPPSARGVRP